MFLLIIKVILGNITLGQILNSLGPIQFMSVDLEPSIDERKDAINEQLIMGISKETSSVTLELLIFFSFFQNMRDSEAVSVQKLHLQRTPSNDQQSLARS